MNSVKGIDIKNCTYYFLDDLTNIKYLDPNKIKTDIKSFKNLLIYDTGYVTANSVKPLYLIVNEINGYIEESNGKKYLTLVHPDESKNALKNMKNYEAKSEIVLNQ